LIGGIIIEGRDAFLFSTVVDILIIGRFLDLSPLLSQPTDDFLISEEIIEMLLPGWYLTVLSGVCIL